MKLLVPLVLSCISSLIINKSNAGIWSSDDEDKFVNEAGCGGWFMVYGAWPYGERMGPFGMGKLLEVGACTIYGYQPHITPEKGGTKVFTTIRDQKVDVVNAKGGTVSIGFTLTMHWKDPYIRTNLS